MPNSPAPQPSWKQEVNRRLAEHKSRKGISVVDQNDAAEASGTGNSRAAAAAARVAARYAQAPSFSELQAAEARAALRVAEAATRAALHAQAAAQAALDKLGTRPEDDAKTYQRCDERVPLARLAARRGSIGKPAVRPGRRAMEQPRIRRRDQVGTGYAGVPRKAAESASFCWRKLVGIAQRTKIPRMTVKSGSGTGSAHPRKPD